MDTTGTALAATPTSVEPGRARRAGTALLIPALLLIIYASQGVWFICTQSLTYDEPLHLAAGLDAWRNQRFEFWNDHPPLARLLFTLPLLSSKWRVDPVDSGHAAVHSDPIATAIRARTVNLALGVILGVLLWFAVRRLWSESPASAARGSCPADDAANFALALYAFSPSLIAHFSLATTDGIGALTIFACALQVIRWRRNPDWGQTIFTGLLLGLLLLAKFYTVPFVVLSVGLMLTLRMGNTSRIPTQLPSRRLLRNFELDFRRWHWRKAGAAVLIAFLTLWAGYFFHTTHVSVLSNERVVTHPNRPAIMKTTQKEIGFWWPAGEFIEGLRQVQGNNERSASGRAFTPFLLGSVSLGRSKLYFPVLLSLKLPIVIVLLGMATALLMVSGKLALTTDLRVLAVYPALMLVLGLAGSIHIGERHMLPVYPFLLVYAGGLWKYAQSATARPWRGMSTAQLLLAVLVVCNAADVVRYAPDYLAYFDVFVRPVNAWKVASDANLDWGQGLIALRHYQQSHPAEEIHLAYFGSLPPASYGVRALPLDEGQHATGTVVISETNMSGQYLNNPNAYHWLLHYPVKTVLAHSMLVFVVPVNSAAGENGVHKNAGSPPQP